MLPGRKGIVCFPYDQLRCWMSGCVHEHGERRVQVHATRSWLLWPGPPKQAGLTRGLVVTAPSTLRHVNHLVVPKLGPEWSPLRPTDGPCSKAVPLGLADPQSRCARQGSPILKSEHRPCATGSCPVVTSSFRRPFGA